MFVIFITRLPHLPYTGPFVRSHRSSCGPGVFWFPVSDFYRRGAPRDERTSRAPLGRRRPDEGRQRSTTNNSTLRQLLFRYCSVWEEGSPRRGWREGSRSLGTPQTKPRPKEFKEKKGEPLGGLRVRGRVTYTGTEERSKRR